MMIKLILLLLTFGISLCFESNNVKVKTSSGLVEGNTVTVLNKTINQFLGIPYAEPPLNSLRFAKPQPLKKPLDGIIDATKPKNACMQSNFFKEKFDANFLNLTESEDCLVLNIWSPNSPTNGTNLLRPVMFWIHGGGFVIGSIFQLPFYDGRVLATNDVVVVSANYRLGAFGFLYGGQESVPGNMGLYDQVLALKWVKENIHLFGGDSKMITIFGESAGSMSVGALILSPISRNLFQRAILQSGAPFFYRGKGGVTKNEALIIAQEMSKSFNCSNDNHWVECLQKVDAQKMNDYNFFGSTTIEGTDFLPLTTEKALKNGNFTKGINIMLGVTKDEGTLLVYLNFPKLNDTLTKTDLTNALKTLMYSGIDSELVSKFYLSNISVENQTALKQAFSASYGDLFITCPTHFFAEEFAKSSPKDSVYFYELTHKLKQKGIIGCEPDWMGICHGSDLGFVFGLPFLMPQFDSEVDRNFTKSVMSLWTNFAKTGKPFLEKTNIDWPTFRKSAESAVISKVFELNPHNFGRILNEPFLKNCDQFWKQFLYTNS